MGEKVHNVLRQIQKNLSIYAMNETPDVFSTLLCNSQVVYHH